MAGIVYSKLLATKSGSKSKDYYWDCDYSKAEPCGAPVPTYPFVNQGDTETVYFRQKHEQSVASYTPPDLKRVMPDLANAYPLGDVNFRDGQAGVWEFDRTFGNIPKQRIQRGQSHRYTFQYVLSDGAKMSVDPEGGGSFSYEGAQYTLGTLCFTVDSTLIRDYFLAGQEDKFPLLEAPQVEQIGQSIQCRGVDYSGGSFPLSLVQGVVVGRTPGIYILAEDDGYDDWLGAMRCRVRRIIKAPDLTFWKTNHS